MAGQTSSSDCSDLIDHSHIPEFEVSPWIKITLASVYVCIFVAGILGNSITIKATRILQKKGYLQKEVTDHMVSLALDTVRDGAATASLDSLCQCFTILTVKNNM